MKLLTAVLSLSTVFLLTPSAYSQDDSDPTGDFAILPPKLIRVYVEYYEVTALDLADIMSEPKAASDDSKLRTNLLARTKAGKATLLESHTLVCRSREKSSTSSVTEYTFPNKYETSKSNDDELKKVHSALVIPTAFETRNLGSTFEVEPILGEDGKTIDIIFKPEIAYLVGETIWGQGPKSDVLFKMPTFYTLRQNTSLTLTSGKFQFTAALTPKDDKGVSDTTKKVLVLLKADIVVIEP
jgi:hypothetical protein